MRGFSRKFSTCVVLVAGAGAASSGCVDNQSTLFVLGAAKISGDCTYEASASTLTLAEGVYDVGFKRSYQVGLILGNQMASRGAKARSRTETSRILLEGAEVTVRDPSGSLVRLKQNPFSSPGAGFVDVGTGNDPGYGTLSVVAIPYEDEPKGVLQDMITSGYVIAEMKAFGHTLGGQAVESNTFSFPIAVCYGCLVSFPLGSVATDGKCLLSGSAEAATTSCLAGQDEVVGCTSCAAKFSVCASLDAKLGD